MRNDNPFGLRGDGSISRRTFMQTAATLGAALAVPGMSIPVFAQDNTFKLGIIRPTTGRLASSFLPSYAGGVVAIDEINAAGGIMGKQIVVLEEDDEASPAKEPAVVRKLQEAGAQVIYGPTGSSQSLAALASTTPMKMITAAYGQATEVGDPKKYPYQFQSNFHTGMQGEVAAMNMVEKLGIKKIAILRESSAFGEQAMAGTMAALDRLGVKPLTDEVFPMTAPDLGAYIANMQKSGAEGVICWIAGGTPSALALSAMHSLGWHPPVIGNTGLFLNALRDQLPPEALENVYATFYNNLTWTDTEAVGERQVALAKKITAAVYKDSKPEHNGMAAPFYDFMHMLKMVIEGEKSFDADVVKKGFEGIKDYDGILGKLSFSPDNHCSINPADVCLASALSGNDEKAMGYFRKRYV